MSLDTLENETEANLEDGGSLYSPDKTPKKFTKRALNTLKKNKTLVYSGGGFGGIILIVVILVFLMAQQLPGFAALLASANMARANRAFARDSTELTSENIALSEESAANQATLETTYSDANTGGILSKLRSYTPSGAINNLKGSGTLEFNYGTVDKGIGKFLGAKEIKSISIKTADGTKTFLASDIAPSKWQTFRHPLTTLGNQASAVSDLSNTIASVDQSGSALLRFGTLRQLVSELGGDPLRGILSSKFLGKSNQDASIELNQEAESQINPPGSSTIPLSEELNNAVADGNAIQAADLTDPKAQAAILANNGVDEAVVAKTAADVQGAINSAKGVLGAVSLPYLIGVPACIIYDGSLQTKNAGQTINKQATETEKTYLLVESTADQEKSGNLNAEGIGAMNAKLGNVINSDVEIAARGGRVNTNSGAISPEGGVNGQYSLFSAILTPTIARYIDPIANTLCPVVTNTAVAIGFTLVQLGTYIAGLFTFGTSDAAEAAAQAAITVAVDAGVQEATTEITGEVVASVTEKLAVDQTINQISTQTLRSIIKGQSAKFYEYVVGGQIRKDTGTAALIVGGTYGLTQLAKAVVMQDMGTTYDGYSQGNDFANQANAGGNIVGNATMQHQYFGAPLSAPEVVYNKNANLAYLSQQNSIKSPYQRYLALSNPYSLLSRLTSGIYADITNFSLSNFIERVASVFNPTRLITDMFSLFRGSKIYASPAIPPADKTDYGVVQWGYTSQEEALLSPTSGDPSYQPLENAKELNSVTVKYQGNVVSASQYISEVYGQCFTDDMGTLLTTKPSIGPDTGNAYIVRLANGNIDPTAGLCSQEYLGPNSQDPIVTKNKNVIFRWRINQSYNQSLDLLMGVQNANK